MNTVPAVKLIEANVSHEKLCASAARISTTLGTSLEIYAKSIDENKNRALIKNVLQSGHLSFIEHATFTFAFCNVSALVEQYFIEFRLASFTVKSRRYVNFANQGYYASPDMNELCSDIYKDHINYLFSEYSAFVNDGIPLEDARFVLPYCFYSNFYCTVNARELIHILRTMKYGRGKNIFELQRLYDQIISQIEPIFPCVLAEIIPTTDDFGRNINCFFDMIPNMANETNQKCELTSYTHNAKELFDVSCHLLGKSNVNESKAMGGRLHALNNVCPRILESISASFVIRNISLSGITHFVRHRMQSIIIPPFNKVCLDTFVVPDSIKSNPNFYSRYQKVFNRNIDVIRGLRKMGLENELYLSLSGNTLDIMSTMNARELMLFFNLRCCGRAQWEIRGIAYSMLSSLREVLPDIFDDMGPSCYTKGYCPEGRLSCGQEKMQNESNIEEY